MAPMSATEAAEVLQGIPDVEERLTARAAGVTHMVWGIAVAAIFLSYAAGARWIEANAQYWLYGVLWIPAVLAGMVATREIWHTHAITLQSNEGGGLKQSLLSMVAFFAIAGVFVVIAYVLLDLNWDMHVIMLLANGAFIAVLSAIEGAACRAVKVPGLLAGGTMIVAALVLGIADYPHGLLGLTAGWIAGAAWFASGLVTAARG